MTIAIRDYAPGTDTTIDGRVYRSDGVTLNWHVAAAHEANPEIQSLRWVWRCLSCGDSGTRPTMPANCPECGEIDPNKMTCFEYLKPAGFAVDIRWRPHNDVSVQKHIPVRDPVISLGGATWMALPTPSLGRYRYTGFGHLFHRTDGLHGEGYSLCLRCGKADSMLSSGERPPSMQNHKRLRGGRDDDKEKHCPGADEPWAIKDHLRIGTVVWTDVFELQLREPGTGHFIDRITAYSIAVALRSGLCRMLGIEEAEIGCAASPTRGPSDEPASSIFLYDTASGGAGYVAELVPHLPELFHETRRVLECTQCCDVACQACLLSHDTQHHVDHLDRKAALRVVDDRFLAGLSLPANLEVFGPASKLELESLPLALKREMQRHTTDELRIYLAGPAPLWEPLAWRLREDLLRWAASGIKLRLIMPKDAIDALSTAQADELNALVAVIGAEVRFPALGPTCAAQNQSDGEALPLALEISGPKRSVRWAASSTTALVPSPDWGGGSDDPRFVRGYSMQPLEPIPSAWPPLTSDMLRRTEPGIQELRLLGELDGPSADFGRRAWQFMLAKNPDFREHLERGLSISHVIYSDRYLRSPLSLLLLHSLLSGLKEFGAGMSDATSVEISTSHVRRTDVGEPYLLHHDWQDDHARHHLAVAYFSGIGQCKFVEATNDRLPHARELQLYWDDGSVWTLRMDQGVGYWRLPPRLRCVFPFSQALDRQIAWICSANVHIVSASVIHPTYWYVRSSHGG